MPSIFLAMPILKEVHSLVLESLLHTSGEQITYVHVESGPAIPIDEKRNRCVEKFLETKCTHLLFWDSDTIAVPNSVTKLLEDNKQIVGATIYKKGGDHAPCFGFMVPERQVYRTPVPFLYNKLIPVDIVGTGFMLIAREVFEKVPPPWFQCYEKGNAQEDIYFCLKAKKYGFQVYVDTGLSLGHIATPYVVTNETYEMHTLWNLVKRFRDEGRLEKFRETLMKEVNLTSGELELEGIPLYRLKIARDVIGYKPSDGLKDAYLQYIKDVSNQEWAISWELCVYLDKLMRALKPKRILDLGSGFSSLLFRFTKAEVITFDTDPNWLTRTELFLQKYNLSTDNMFKLDSPLSVKDKEILQAPYDLTLLDLGVAETDRVPLFSLLNSKVIILDDMHIAEYRAQAAEFFKNRTIFSLQDDTKDAYDRYVWMVV